MSFISFQIAMNGFTEVLTWILCSHKENFDMLNRKDDKSAAVIIGNPRSADFEVCKVFCYAGVFADFFVACLLCLCIMHQLQCFVLMS